MRELAGEGRIILLYVGNLERYQGIDLLLEGFSRAAARAPGLALVLIGGSDEDLARYRRRVAALGLTGSAHLIGPRPVEHLRAYLRQADVLISPRTQGTNTPMKIYSFLDAGVPVAATRLRTHLQVLDERIACLFEPTPEDLATALVDLASRPDRRQSLARAAGHRVARLYSPRAYTTKANAFLLTVASHPGIPVPIHMKTGNRQVIARHSRAVG